MINQICPWLVSSLEIISTSNAAFSPASLTIFWSSTNIYELDTKQESKMHQISFYVQQLYIEEPRVTQSGKTWKRLWALFKMTNFHLTAKTDRTCCFYGHAGPKSWSHTRNKVQQEDKQHLTWAHTESLVIPLQSLSESTKHPMSSHELNMRTPQRNPTDDTRKLLNDLPPTPSPFDFDLDQQQQITCSVRGRSCWATNLFTTTPHRLLTTFLPLSSNSTDLQ